MVNRAVDIAFDEKKIDAIFAELDSSHLPGAAVGVAIGGEPVYRKGFGLANIELPVVLSPSIRMRIGSATKHFTSLAYLLLCEDGRAGIDDPIGRYLPELHPVTHAVTARQLMGHLGGLRDAHEICWQFSGTGHAVSSDDLLSLYRNMDEVDAPPGAAWSYNNGGYLMLSSAIERITGQSLENVFRERIFAPIGMNDTMLRRWDTDFVSNSATLHTSNSAGAFEKSYLGTALAGEGGIVSSVDDMLRWLSHMSSPRVGTVSTWESMKTPLSVASGISTGYALGLIHGQYRGLTTLFHGGGVLGGNCQMLKVPAADLDIIVLVNRQDVSAALLCNQIIDTCFPNLEPVETRSTGALIAGTFRSLSTGRVIQIYGKNGQQIVSIDGFEWPFALERDGILRPAPPWSYMNLTVAPVGNQTDPASIRFQDYGALDELVAQKPPRHADPSPIVGRYCSTNTRTMVTISCADEGPRLHSIGQFGSFDYQLVCLGEGVWRAHSGRPIPWDGIVAFNPECTEFRFSSLRTRALTFRRCS